MIVSLLILCSINQSALAETSSESNTSILVNVFQPIDVVADSGHVFVLHRMCLPPKGDQYYQDTFGTFYCPGFTASYCNLDKFQSEIISIDSSGRESAIASLFSPFGCQQRDHIAISSGMGGFPKNYLFISQGSWGRVNIWKLSYDGKSASLFTSNIPPLGSDVDITFDTVGSFGYDMIVTGGNQIWKVDSNGKASHIAQVPVRVHKGGSFGGAVVAPLDFGTYGGNILAPDQGIGNIFSVSPNYTVTKIGSWLGSSEILFIPQKMCTFGKLGAFFLSSHATDTGGSIVMYPKTSFENRPTAAIITNQYKPSMALMTLNNNEITIKQFQSNIKTQFLEGSTFVSC